MDEVMVNAAKKALKEVLELKKGEKYLVVTDETNKPIGEAFFEAGKKITSDIDIYLLPEERRPLKEIPDELLKKIEGINIATTLLKGLKEETPFRVKLIKKIMSVATRLGHGPGITEDMMTKGPMNVDYKKMAETAENLMKVFKGSEKAIISAPGGTNITVEIKERDFKTDVKIKPGNWGNLPGGEVWCGPVENGANGTIVCDGSIGDIGMVPTPLTIEVKKGKVMNIKSDNNYFNEQVQELLSIDEESDVIGELGIGINPNAKITGNMLEDEKAFKTCHIAFGHNTDMPGGKNTSKTHRDFLIKDPTITVVYEDGSSKKIMKDGNLMV